MEPKMLKVAAGTAALLALGAGTAAAAVTAPAKATAANAVTWKSGLSKVVGVTTAVTGVKVNATITEFAFVQRGSLGAEDTKPVMYTRVNSGVWREQAIPGTQNGEAITAATAITANHVVAVASLTKNFQITGSVVLSYDEGRWSTVEKFSGADGITVLSAGDIWAFGAAGTYHYNGKTWQKITGSVNTGAGVSATSAWVETGTATVEHIVGDKVASKANLASLIPYDKGFGGPGLDGVYATSATTAYAIGDGHAQDQGGPLSVLEFNGKSWKRVASLPGGMESAVSSDGAGGLYIVGKDGIGGTPALVLHYAKGSGKLGSVSVPGATNVAGGLDAAANIRGTAVEILGGDALKFTSSSTTNYATLFTTN
jgi:hypothetical protein